MRQAQGIYSGQNPGYGGAPGGTGGGGLITPGMQAAMGVNPSSGGGSSGMGALGGAALGAIGGPLGALAGGLLGNSLFKKNRPYIQDIAAAMQNGTPITDSQWAQAGYGPGGAALNGSGGAQPLPNAPTGAGAGTAGGYASQYPSLSPTTQDALARITDRATQGSPLLQTAQDTVQNFAGGGAIQNPYLDQMFNRGADKIRDYTNAQFTLGGRGNSTTNQDILGKNIGDYASQFYGNAYDQGQNRQLAAAQIAPNLANQDYYGLQQLLGAGQIYDQQALNQYNAPWQALQNYSGAVTGIGGLGHTATQTAPSQSMLPQLLGAGISALPYLLAA